MTKRIDTLLFILEYGKNLKALGTAMIFYFPLEKGGWGIEKLEVVKRFTYLEQNPIL